VAEQLTEDAFGIMGVKINTRPMDELRSEIIDAINKRSQIKLACANPHSLVVAQNDTDFFNALRSFEHVVADGVGVTLAAKLSGYPELPRIRGADYYLSVMTSLNAMEGKKVFFLGSTESVLKNIKDRVLVDYPNIADVETLSPPFGEWSDDKNTEIIEEINRFAPDVVWVGMTAPRQEKWIFRNHARLSAPIIGAIGAVFDFYAGTYKRAPVWMQERGLEWLYRLSREPRRLWRRNFVSAPKFFALLFKDRIGLTHIRQE
jgi:N-acetylglucosaminyldiphosphoundecaprenol N-acetyl-beta-D-mannosaminyltransferase